MRRDADVEAAELSCEFMSPEQQQALIDLGHTSKSWDYDRRWFK